MNKRKSFIIHLDSLNILDELTDEQAGKLFKGIKAYYENQEIVLDSLTKIAFIPFKNQFDRDNEKYEGICKRNKINGLKGGRPKTQDNPNNPDGFPITQRNPNKPDSDSDSDSDNDNDSKNKKEDIKKKRSLFQKPSIKEIKEYCLERKNGIDAEQFFSHYESNGWKVGKNSMKKWQAAIITWEKRDKKDNPDAVISSISREDRAYEEDKKLYEEAVKEGLI